MRWQQSGQSLVEWAISAFVVLLFGLGLLAEGQVMHEYMAVRAAASQAAFAAARAPSQDAAQATAHQAAAEAVRGSQLRDVALTVDLQGFQRGGTLTTTASGCVNLEAFSIAARALGPCVPLRWPAHAVIEPYRSRVAP